MQLSWHENYWAVCIQIRVMVPGPDQVELLMCYQQIEFLLDFTSIWWLPPYKVSSTPKLSMLFIHLISSFMLRHHIYCSVDKNIKYFDEWSKEMGEQWIFCTMNKLNWIVQWQIMIWSITKMTLCFPTAQEAYRGWDHQQYQSPAYLPCTLL